MIQLLLEYYTTIDEVRDLFSIWSKLQEYFEITLELELLPSFILSTILSFAVIVGPPLIAGWVISVLWHMLKRN